MKIYSLTGFPSALTGSFTGSFVGDGSGLSGTDSGSWDGDFVGSAKITGSLSLSGSFKDQESSPGTAGQVLSSTVSGSKWINAADSGAITGAGTTGTITKWTTGGSVIGDSIIAESASTITVNGVGKFTGNILALANIGVGMTPDTSWGSNSHIINLGIANADAGHIGWREQGGADELSIGWNVYHNNTDWYYASSNPANLYTQISSGHVFKVAASGTEDNAISWINALSISSVGLATFTPNGGNGTGAVNALHLKNTGTSANDGTSILFTAGTSADGAAIKSTGQAFNSSDLRFFTGGSAAANERLTIASGGNVGIGITSPSVKLDVGGASNSDSIARFAKTSEGTLLLGGNVGPSNCPFIGSENNFDFAFITNNTEKMRITTTGNVSVGAATVGHLGVRGLTNNSSAYAFEAANSSGNSILLVRNDGKVGIATTPSASSLNVRYQAGGTDASESVIAATIGNDSTLTSAGITIRAAGNRGNRGNAAGSNLFKAEFNDATAMLIDKNGQIQIGGDAALVWGSNGSTDPYIQGQSSTDELYFGRANGFQMAIRSDNVVDFKTGIRFINGGNTTLDAYEEGTWTVSLPNGGTIGTQYNAQYTIIGNICHFNFYVAGISGITSNSSAFRVALPIAASSTTNDYVGANIAYSGNFNTSTFLPIVNDGAGGTYLYFHKNSGTSAQVLNSEVTSLSELIMSGWYYI